VTTGCIDRRFGGCIRRSPGPIQTTPGRTDRRAGGLLRRLRFFGQLDKL